MTVTDRIEQSYDEIPYPSLCYTETHPDRLATLAELLGLSPQPVENARVLELGCAVGGNLIPMAYGLPGSHFKGVDFSARQIQIGQEVISDLGLKNISLKQMDVMDIGADFGQFDYIIAHGLYAWVPDAVREKVLEICKNNLSPNGVAYISYNTYPGWHMLETVRDLLLYHTRSTQHPVEKAAMARDMIAFLAASLPEEGHVFGSFINAYARLLKQQIETSADRGDALLLHDELAEINDPLYFHQFYEHIEQYDLQYLTEADFPTVIPTNFEPQVAQKLMGFAKSLVEIEQYMDFIRNRTFRKTLICHANLSVKRTLKPDLGLLSQFSVASRALPVDPDIDIKIQEVAKFRALDGAIFSTDHPTTKSALVYLSAVSPLSIPFDKLYSIALNRLHDGDAPQQPSEALQKDMLVLGANLLKAFSYSMNLVELHSFIPEFTIQISDHPVASPIARYFAGRESRIPNLRHERVQLDLISQQVLKYLDGDHDRQALLDLVTKIIAAAEIETECIHKPDPAEELDRVMSWIARSALLVG